MARKSEIRSADCRVHGGRESHSQSSPLTTTEGDEDDRLCYSTGVLAKLRGLSSKLIDVFGESSRAEVEFSK